MRNRSFIKAANTNTKLEQKREVIPEPRPLPTPPPTPPVDVKAEPSVPNKSNTGSGKGGGKGQYAPISVYKKPSPKSQKPPAGSKGAGKGDKPTAVAKGGPSGEPDLQNLLLWLAALSAGGAGLGGLFGAAGGGRGSFLGRTGRGSVQGGLAALLGSLGGLGGAYLGRQVGGVGGYLPGAGLGALAGIGAGAYGGGKLSDMLGLGTEEEEEDEMPRYGKISSDKQYRAPKYAGPWVKAAEMVMVKRARDAFRSVAADLFNGYLDKVASCLPAERQVPVRLMQAHIAAGGTVNGAIKMAYPHLPGESRGVLGYSLIKSASDHLKKNGMT